MLKSRLRIAMNFVTIKIYTLIEGFMGTVAKEFVEFAFWQRDLWYQRIKGSVSYKDAYVTSSKKISADE